ncbi:MAG: YkgJ family cysteine cluster protein [Planctomycetota bacterium]
MTEPAAESPGSWWREGIRFECARCGGCCSGAPGYVWVDVREIESLAGALRMPIAELRRRHTRRVHGRVSLVERPGGDCVFLVRPGNACAVYAARPLQCRTFPFWEENLKSEEAWKANLADCPGARRGPVVPAEQIRRRLDGEPAAP